MKNKKIISVIVPIYNVERYLSKCIQSIIKQTYTNLEIILVDDGATDRSGLICDEFEKIDTRIKVIHKKNGGLSSARNAGLDLALGDYIGFVDSDDFIEFDMYEKMLNMMIKHNCDLVECAVNIVKNDNINFYKKDEDLLLNGKKALELQLKSIGNNFIPRIAVWSKLFKKKFWENRRFPEGKVHEDYMLTCEALYESKQVGILKEGLYNHLVTNYESIVNSSFGKKDLFLEKQNYSRIEYLKQKKETELLTLAKQQYYFNILTLYWKCELNDMEESRYYLELLNKNKNEITTILNGYRINQFKLIWFSPILYIFCRKIVQIVKGTLK